MPRTPRHRRRHLAARRRAEPRLTRTTNPRSLTSSAITWAMALAVVASSSCALASAVAASCLFGDRASARNMRIFPATLILIGRLEQRGSVGVMLLFNHICLPEKDRGHSRPRSHTHLQNGMASDISSASEVSAAVISVFGALPTRSNAGTFTHPNLRCSYPPARRATTG
jgi:hypothetical protein